MNLPAYLRRICYVGTVQPTLDILTALHRAHATSIPFENLDIQLGRRIHLEPDRLEEKLVEKRRGGYCFEQNSLALHALRAIGFDVTACEARVRLGATRVAPRTHMVLVVSIDGTPWLWDTGFGGDTPLEPVPMDGGESHQGGASYRVAAEGPLRIVRMNVIGEWADLYAFVPEPREPVDFEVGNWYTSTHPDSHFVTTLTAQLRTSDGSRVLRNLSFTVNAGAHSETREVARGQLPGLLREAFGLEFPRGTKFRAIDGADGGRPRR